MPAPYAIPFRRPLQIFAFDPMVARAERTRVVIDIPNEPLRPGPQGERIQVVDYDSTSRCLYEPVDLDNPAVLLNQGMTPTESDPRFHQQMVYAVAMKVLENFDEGLGRRGLRFANRGRLRIFPHAFEDANAFYDPVRVAVVFGYFRADARDPGRNIPGQTIFTCLSHDIIAHEVTHALIHRLRGRFIDATNPEVLAFHEAFADIVAIFQHFSFRDALVDAIHQTRGDLRSAASLLRLAQQFGHATGSGKALRTAIEEGEPVARPREKLTDAHNLGSSLVAAVFGAFFTVYQRRVENTVRFATGGSGRLPEGNLHPELATALATEASRTAGMLLRMCIRAIDYLPLVDVTFSDFLRALLTSDHEMEPDDALGWRPALIESFRARGIYPDPMTLAEDGLRWPQQRNIPNLPLEPFERSIAENVRSLDARVRTHLDTAGNRKWLSKLVGWAQANAALLQLDPTRPIALHGFHAAIRSSSRGQILTELVAEFEQADLSTSKDPAYGGLTFRGGCTVIASADGQVRYVVAKPLTPERRQTLMEHVTNLDQADPHLAWCSDHYLTQRMKLRTNFAALHRRLY